MASTVFSFRVVVLKKENVREVSRGNVRKIHRGRASEQDLKQSVLGQALFSICVSHPSQICEQAVDLRALNFQLSASEDNPSEAVNEDRYHMKAFLPTHETYEKQ